LKIQFSTSYTANQKVPFAEHEVQCRWISLLELGTLPI